MENRKLIELIEKKNLSEDEKILLNKLIADDKEARNFYNTYNKINEVLNLSVHLSTDEISDYVLYKNNSEPENKFIGKLIPKIESHLRECSGCNEEFKLLNEEFNNIDSFLASELKAEGPGDKTEKIPPPAKSKINFSRYISFAIFILAGLYLLLFLFSEFSKPDYYELAMVEDKSDFYTTRGRTTTDFIKSLNSLDEGNYDEAINYLQSDIENNPDDPTIFYSYYILGLTYLENANSGFIGLFPDYNSYYAEQALKNLQAAVRKNKSGEFENITFDALFYSAKANLMLGNIKEAKKDLFMVIDNKGSKMDEAGNILAELE